MSLRPSLSASQLDHSVRRSPSHSPVGGRGGRPHFAFGRTNPSHPPAHTPGALAKTASTGANMAATQRILKVMNSHPIQRPPTHLASTAHTLPASASASASRGRSASPRGRSLNHASSSHTGRGVESEFDVLSGFRRELERVRQDVNDLANSERHIEARQNARMAELAQTAPAPTHTDHTASSSSYSRGASATQIPPSVGLLSTISTLLRSPKLGGGGRPRSLSPPLSMRNSARTNPPPAFGLAPPMLRPSPFARSSRSRSPSPPPPSSHFASSYSARGNGSFSSSSATAAPASSSSTDPHVSSLASRGASLLGTQFAALDQSRARLDALTSELHHWKRAQSLLLERRVAEIEAQYERERAALETRARSEVERAVQDHARAVEAHVQQLGQAVEREFKQTGAVSGAFNMPTSYTNGASSSSFGPGRSSNNAASSSFTSAALASSAMRLEHLDGRGHTYTQQQHKQRDLSSDDESQQSVAVEQRRKRLQYAPAVSGAGATALSRSQPLSGSLSAKKPARATVASVLHSSDSEEDEETRTRRRLVQQAASLQAARARRREAAVAVAMGVSGRSRGRSQQRQQQQEEVAARAASEARRVLESSSDDESDQRRSHQPASVSSRRSFRDTSGASVSFAATPSRSSSASYSAHRAPNGTAPDSSPTGRHHTPASRRRGEREQAASVYGISSDDEEAEEPHVAPIDMPIVRVTASNGRVTGTPAKTAPSLAQLNSQFQQRVEAIRAIPGRTPGSSSGQREA